MKFSSFLLPAAVEPNPEFHRKAAARSGAGTIAL